VRIFTRERPPEVVLIAIMLLVMGFSDSVRGVSGLIINRLLAHSPSLNTGIFQLFDPHSGDGFHQAMLFANLLIAVGMMVCGIALLRRSSWVLNLAITVLAAKVLYYLINDLQRYGLFAGIFHLDAQMALFDFTSLLLRLLYYGMLVYLLTRRNVREYLGLHDGSDELAVDLPPATGTQNVQAGDRLLSDAPSSVAHQRLVEALSAPFRVMLRSAGRPEIALIGTLLLYEGIKYLLIYFPQVFVFHPANAPSYYGLLNWASFCISLLIGLVGAGLLSKASWSRYWAVTAIALSAVMYAAPLLITLSMLVANQMRGLTPQADTVTLQVMMPVNILTLTAVLFEYAAMLYLLTRPGLVEEYDGQEEAFEMA
jgi:hypothetical protein